MINEQHQIKLLLVYAILLMKDFDIDVETPSVPRNMGMVTNTSPTTSFRFSTLSFDYSCKTITTG